jgi:uncharacterized protein
MTETQADGSEAVFDASPYLKLVIDKECRWFQNGAEITHPQIYQLFNRFLERTADGGYQVRMGREVCRVEVEDAPFMVRRITTDDRGAPALELNDGSRELLDPHRFWIGEANVPYCEVKEGLFFAKFSRAAYYELARHIVTDDDEHFFIELDGSRIPVATSRP